MEIQNLGYTSVGTILQSLPGESIGRLFQVNKQYHSLRNDAGFWRYMLQTYYGVPNGYIRNESTDNLRREYLLRRMDPRVYIAEAYKAYFDYEVYSLVASEEGIEFYSCVLKRDMRNRNGTLYTKGTQFSIITVFQIVQVPIYTTDYVVHSEDVSEITHEKDL